LFWSIICSKLTENAVDWVLKSLYTKVCLPVIAYFWAGK
jgi:hypothetical protein